MTQCDIWKSVDGYGGRYEVSNTGKVRSLNYENMKIVRELKQCKHRKGYLLVLLYSNGKGKLVKVHRLVAEAFIPNPNNLPQVNHKDEDKTNNNVDNLEWCTNKYNANYGTKIKRVSHPIIQLDKAGNVVAHYSSLREASRQSGIHMRNIWRCCRQENGQKTAGGYVWKYEYEGRLYGHGKKTITE